ncbi:MAG TPA: EamA family transporter [Longimicrobiales bacterium]|nr:EamA family transporter [Longimicrobiales bacterium]
MRLKLFAAFAAVYLLWGSTYLFIHFALEDLRPFFLAGARLLTAGAILFAWARWRSRAPALLAREWRACAITGALFFLCGNGAVVWSQQRLPSGIVALLVAVVPLWVVMLQWTLPPHYRPGAPVMLGIILGLAGLAILVGFDALTSTGPIDPMAALVLAGGSLAWAFGTLYAQRAALPKSPLVTAGAQMLCGGALLALTSLITREPARMQWSSISAGAILSMVYLITFGSIIAFTAYGWLVRVAPAARVATYAYVNPVVAMFLGWLFADERLSARTLLASAVVLSGVALITMARRPAATTPPAPDARTRAPLHGASLGRQ